MRLADVATPALLADRMAKMLTLMPLDEFG
jgi:hypothetical protein